MHVQNYYYSNTCLTVVLCSLYFSYNWRSEYVDKYRSLLPDAPRIVDPANPANNVWYSGFKGYRRGEKPNDYEPGDGNSTVLKRYIHNIDLSQAV